MTTTPMKINSGTYKLTATTSGAVIQYAASGQSSKMLIIYNSGSVPVFAQASKTDNSATIALPNSATAPVNGKMIAPGATVTYVKDSDQNFLGLITASGSTDVYVSAGGGV